MELLHLLLYKNMIVYNTTYHAHNAIAEEFLAWLKSNYIPKAVCDGRLAEPRLTTVMNAEESDGINYSLQFRSESTDVLRNWYEEVGDDLLVELSNTFGQKVAGFSTLLEEIDL